MVFDLKPGTQVYIETFTKNYVGRVSRVTPTTAVLDGCAWVADTGRYHEFLRTGRSQNMEIEPMGDGVEVPLAYLSLVKDWPHPLFTEPV